VGRWLNVGAPIAALLVAFGVATSPGFLAADRGALGAVALTFVLGGYILAGRMAAPAVSCHEPDAMACAWRFGLVAAAVYAAEVTLEYVLTPADNTAWGVVEFGLVFLSFAAAGASAAWRTGRWRSAALAGGAAAMGAGLAWYIVVLAVFYLFRGSARQDAVLRAEGDFDDFRRSGEASLQIFLMGDFVGAGFFHLLLSPVVGAVLGLLGGGAGLAARMLRPPSRA
jgi:hypothetical protein